MSDGEGAMRPLHLASSSPRRREILTALGIAHSFAGVDIDETPRSGESPRELALRLALEKARAARPPDDATPLVLAADTVVSIGSELFGKPANEEGALYMLGRLSGRTHAVLTAVALLDGRRQQSALSLSEVRFRRIAPREARAYWRTGEPRGKAGAYAIQGRGGIFVEKLSGSHSGVMGLPVFETAELLKRAGVDVLWNEVSDRGRRA